LAYKRKGRSIVVLALALSERPREDGRREGGRKGAEKEKEGRRTKRVVAVRAAGESRREEIDSRSVGRSGSLAR